MLNKLNWLDIEIGACKYHIRKAEDTKNVDMFNMYFTRLKKLYKQRKEILQLKIIKGV